MKINKKDLFIFLFPLILVLIFLLTDAGKFAFDLRNPRLLKMFTSSFVHWNLNHLIIGNIVPYYIFIVPAWYFSKVTGNEKKLYFSFLSILILLPFVSKLMYIYTVSPGFENTAGFSGTVLGFSALTVISFLFFLKDTFSFKLNQVDLIASFLVFVCLPVFFYDFGSIEIFLWLLLALSSFWMIYRFKKERLIDKVSSMLKDYDKIASISKLIVFVGCSILFFVFYIVFFPAEFVEAEVNVFSHLSGFVGGFVIGYLIYFSISWKDRFFLN